MLNTNLVDANNGRSKFTILTRAVYVKGKSAAFVDVASRSTTITNSRGLVIARIEWTGKERRSGGLIYISDYDPIKISELFDGCDSISAGYVESVFAVYRPWLNDEWIDPID